MKRNVWGSPGNQRAVCLQLIAQSTIPLGMVGVSVSLAVEFALTIHSPLFSTARASATPTPSCPIASNYVPASLPPDVREEPRKPALADIVAAVAGIIAAWPVVKDW